MKIREQRDSSIARQAKGIKKRRKGASPAATKKTPFSLSTVLCDSLESYDRVLSCASKGKLYFCSLPELHSVLKVNGFQSCHLTKDYIEKHFSILSGALFQTRFNSLIIEGDTVITAVALEDSEVVQDLAALQWLDGARKNLILLPSEERTSLGERQPNCALKVTLAGLADDLVESSATISSLKTSHPADFPVEEATDLVALSVDDCYQPDMSMVMMSESIQAGRSPSMCSPDQSIILYSQEEILMNGLASQPEGRLLTELSMPFFCFKEQPSHLFPPVASHTNSGSASKGEHGVQRSYASLANIEISDARAKLQSEERDMIEKFPPFTCQTSESSSSRMRSLPFINGGVLKSLDQNYKTSALCTKNHVISDQEAEPPMQPDYRSAPEVKELSSHFLISSPGLVEEPAQSSPLLLDSEHVATLSQHICQAQLKTELTEKLDLAEKFAMEALQLNIFHNLFKEDDLSGTHMVDETASQGNMQIVAHMHDFPDLEEDQSSNSSQIRELQLNFPVYMVPSPKQTSTEGLVSFLGLMAQVSAQRSNELESAKSS